MRSLFTLNPAQQPAPVATTTATSLATTAKQPTIKLRNPRRTETKKCMIIAMLRDPEGTTVADLQEATGWQEHSIRSRLSTLDAETLPKAPGAQQRYRMRHERYTLAIGAAAE